MLRGKPIKIHSNRILKPCLPWPVFRFSRLLFEVDYNCCSNTADPGPLSQASRSNVPVSLLPRPRVNDNTFPGLSSGSDDEYCTWLCKNKLTLLLGASSYKRFDAGYFQGTFINPTLYSTLGARWSPNAPTSNRFVHAGLSAAFRSQAFNFSPTQQADLNLPVLSL